MAGFGSKSNQNASEHVGVEARTCGGLVRGKIVLETHETASICVDFGPGRSWECADTVTQCLWLEMDETGSERRRNTSKWSHLMPECFRGVNEVIHHDSQGGKPRDAK